MTNKDLLRQYANTGAILTNYQIGKLSGNLQKTYLRRRMAQAKQNPNQYSLTYHELRRLSNDMMMEYLRGLSFLNQFVFDDYLTNEQKRYYVEMKLNDILNGGKSKQMLNHEFLWMSPEQIKQYEEAGNVVPNAIKDKLEIVFSSEQERIKYFLRFVENKQIIPSWTLRLIDSYEMFKTLLPLIEKNVLPEGIPMQFRKEYAMYCLKKSGSFSRFLMDVLPKDDLQECLIYFIDNNLDSINDAHLEEMSKETFDYYIKKVNNDE